MKKVLFFAALVVLAACNSKAPETTETAKPADATVAEIKSPYPVGYSSKFTIGDPKNAESVLALWKIWESGDLSGSKDIFADSVTLNFADGSMMSGSKDSVIAGAQQFRSTLASSVSTVDVILAVKSTDKDENWGLIWGKEINTDKKGKVDSTYLQEAWQFNKDGKVRQMFQFKAAAAAPKK
ncbi:MAG: hypothetical protein WDN26_12560 [Chitinophagaceae bacterium]